MDNNNYPYQKSIDEYYCMGNAHNISAPSSENTNYMLPHNGKSHNIENPHLPTQPIPLHQSLPNPHLHQPYAGLPMPSYHVDYSSNYNLQPISPPSIYHPVPHPAYALNYQAIDHSNPAPPTDLRNIAHKTDPPVPESEPTNYSKSEPVPQSQETKSEIKEQPISESEKCVDKNSSVDLTSIPTHAKETEITEIQSSHNSLEQPNSDMETTETSEHTKTNESEPQNTENVEQVQANSEESSQQSLNDNSQDASEKPAGTFKPRLSAIARYNPNSPVFPKKKRRRIVLLNDDDDSDDNANELKRELLTKSPTPEVETNTVAIGENDDATPAEEDKPSEEQDPMAESSGEGNSESSENEETLDPASTLLKNAVIIQAAETKKKKRVLDSDDEDQTPLTSVDDIGVESNENELEEPLCDDILVCETSPNLESISAEAIETVIPIENPIIPQDDLPEENEISDQPAESQPEKSPKEPVVENEKGPSEEKESPEEKSNDTTSKETEKEVDSKAGIIKNVKREKVEDDIDPAEMVVATLKKEKNTSDDEHIPNDVYFGTPDIEVLQSTTKPMARKPRPSTSQSKRQMKRKRRDEYEKETSSESSGSDSTYSESSSEESSDDNRNAPRKQNVLVRRPALVRPAMAVSKPKFTFANMQAIKKMTPPRRRAVKDRFYDRSRDIPNDVYFGDVKVPLHVLHTRWGSDASDSSSSEAPEPIRFGYSNYSPNMRTVSSNIRHISPMMRKPQNMPSRPVMRMVSKSRKPAQQPSALIDLTEDPKLATYKNFVRLAGIKINYIRLFEGISAVDDKCILIRRVLASKGLQGEPTVAKCKQLKLDLQTKREIADLDTSAIIKGRTRRSSGRINNTKSSTSNSLQPETLQTLSKIKRVIDSDSD